MKCKISKEGTAVFVLFSIEETNKYFKASQQLVLDSLGIWVYKVLCAKKKKKNTEKGHSLLRF